MRRARTHNIRARSIRAQVAALHETGWRVSQDPADWRRWRGCLLVNPLCPDDLCVLPREHDGTEQGYHILGTTPWHDPLKLSKESVMFLAEAELDLEGLVRYGWERQRELRPE